MKTLVRNIVADMMWASGLGAALRRAATRSLAILCYHRILPSDARAACPFPELVVTPEVFASHVEFCRQHYHCVPLREALGALTSRRRRRRPLLAVTLDDGYTDNFDYARPVLQDLQVRATFFVVSSLVGADTSPWYDQLGRALKHLRGSTLSANAPPIVCEDAEARRLVNQFTRRDKWTMLQLVNAAKALQPVERATLVDQLSGIAAARGGNRCRRDRIMTAEQLVQLAADGHEVASHTRSHPILTQLSPEEVTMELERSRSELSATIGDTVSSFSYPNGDHNDDVVAATSRAGYRCAVTTRSGLNGISTDPLRLKRFFVSQTRLSRPSGHPSDNALAMELTGVAEKLFLRHFRRSRAR